MSWEDFVVPGVTGLLLAYQLWAGELFGQRPRVTRSEQPLKYWLVNLIVAAVGLLFFNVSRGNAEYERRQAAELEAAQQACDAGHAPACAKARRLRMR